MRLGVKIVDPDNLRRAYAAFRPSPTAPLDVFCLAAALAEPLPAAGAGLAGSSGARCATAAQAGRDEPRSNGAAAPTPVGRSGGTAATADPPAVRAPPLPPRASASRASPSAATADAAGPSDSRPRHQSDTPPPSTVGGAGAGPVAPATAVASGRRALAVPRAVTPAPFRSPSSAAA